ncbi:HAMP domain-containing protein [Halalkalibacter nanhaiisediminis]|uniref:HAMP domain-containing protein n=1 Tax=Halalkalibacter nanhaiisediminis TaxID=688079 RepID=A0A562QGV0_9BACI|nr:methyl-accepting chemotaxis protein [Halalkalibacter nanhaiisediminis]TWI55978.1 HAMP domain-containing protein [Halalkalibacter nanhaiisediminis]
MKKNNVLNQLIFRIGFVILIVLIATLAIAYYVVHSEFQEQQFEQINTMQETVVQAMENTYVSTKAIEHLIDMKLLTASKGIAEELEGKEINEITGAELIALKEQWNLYDISLFVRENDDIVVAQATDENEMGLSSKDWGYWFTAFNQLMDGEVVSVDKGFGIDNYWVGPISRSEWEDKYYKYAYYYMEDTDILINPYVIDEDIYTLTYELGANAVIEKILTENPDFEEIAVINVPAWSRGEENDVVEPEFDLPVLYGNHEIVNDQDEALFERVSATGNQESILFETDGQKVKKTYFPLSENRVMTIVSSLDRMESFEKKMSAIIVISFLVMFAVLLFMIRLIAKQQLKPLQTLTTHIKRLSEGDFTQKIIMAEKNEWGWLAENMNEMTEMIHVLIADMKKEIHSLHYVSGILANQSHESMEKMKDVSVKMTDESKVFLIELNDRLENFIQRINETMNKSQTDNLEVEKVDKTIIDIQEDLQSFIRYAEEHAYNISDFSVMLLHTINELSEAIEHLDNLSENLKEKVKVFKVNG